MLFTLAMIVLNIAFWIALHFSIGDLINFLPEKLQKSWFDFRRPFFRVSSGEIKFYRRIGLPKWKDRLPQNNRGFNKRNLPENVTREYLEKFVSVTCQAEVIHYLIAAAGYFSLLFCLLCDKPRHKVPLFFGIATFMAIGNLPFAMIQRYNRCRMLKVLERLPASKAASKHGK